jgi:prevent-host-death family protein
LRLFSESKNPVGRHWQLQDAKNRLSQLIENAKNYGPQTITLRGKPTAVVVSFEEYARLTKPQLSLVDFLRQSPLFGVKLQLERSRDTGREIEL